MKKLESKKTIIALLVVLAVVLGLTVTSLAEDTGVTTIQPTTVVGNNVTNTNVNTVTNTNTNTNVNTNINTNVNKTNTSSSYNNTNLPSTGIEDYSMLFIVAGALAIISVIAYRKANYYRNVK